MAQIPQNPLDFQSPTNLGTKVLYEEENLLQALKDSEVAGIGFPAPRSITHVEDSLSHIVATQAQWTEPTKPMNMHPMSSQNGLNPSDNKCRSSFSSGTEVLNRISRDGALDLTSPRPGDPLAVQYQDLFRSHNPARVPSPSTAITEPSTFRIHSSPAERDLGSSFQRLPVKDTNVYQTFSTKPAILDSPVSAQEPISETAEMRGDSKESFSRLMLTVEAPSSEMINDIMGVVAKSKTRMKLDVS